MQTAGMAGLLRRSEGQHLHGALPGDESLRRSYPVTKRRHSQEAQGE